MNENILKNIKVLPTLPQSIAEVNAICANVNSSVADLAKVVKKDPVATGLLLKIANSSLYGSKNIKTVEMAVSLFGKAVTKSYVMSSAIANSFKLDFTPYSMLPDDFARVSQLRTSLMFRWINEVNKDMLDTLTTAAQLGNLGQVLVAQDIIKNGKIDDFKEAILEGDSIENIELNMVGYTTLEVTAMILEHWKLDNLLIESIKYSTSLDSVHNAPAHIKDYALANYIVFQSIDETGRFVDDDNEALLDILADNRFDEGRFMDILTTLKGVEL